MEIKFRYAEPSDLANIVATYNSTVASKEVTADLEPVSVESKKSWFESHNTTNRPLWIVELHGKYAGWMSFNSFYGRPAYAGTVELSLYLNEAMRGRGLGKICLQYAISEASTRNIHTLLGFIFAHNYGSVRLFQKLGFEQWAKLPAVADMGDTMRDLLIFGLKIQA